MTVAAILSACASRAPAQVPVHPEKPDGMMYPLMQYERPARQFVVLPAPAPGAPGTLEGMRRKMSAIIIPAMEFHGTRLADAVEFLRQEARRLDASAQPTDRGVNILLKAPVPGPVTAPPLAPAKDAGTTPITLNLGRIPLLEALRYVALQAGLKVKLEPYAVALVPLSEPDPQMITETFRVPPSFFSVTPAAPADGLK